jgi:hypothetical protein
MLDEARERLGTIEEIASALADALPAPKTGPSRSRRRRRRKKKPTGEAAVTTTANGEVTAEEQPVEAPTNGDAPAEPRRRRRRRKPQVPDAAGGTDTIAS